MVKKEVRRMKKLICISLFVVFTFLTGGINYSYKTQGHYSTGTFIGISHKEEIRVFGFFREKYGEEFEDKRIIDRNLSYGWGLHPSLKIFSISRERMKEVTK
jgi:hypothetical protein